MYFDDEYCKDEMIREAKADLLQLQAAKILLTNNDFDCEIHICGMTINISENNKLIPVVNAEIIEINKYLNGEPNTWE